MDIANSPKIDDLLHRICAEYAEMPGLRVTHDQAQRLWRLGATTCREALECLVDVRFLTLTSAGHYARLTEGPIRTPNLQMAVAVLRDKRRQRRAS